MKGRDDMNIFQTHNEFAGRFDPDSTGSSLLSLLTIAQNIRRKLGRQGYLLDNYLSLFFEAANSVLAYEAANDGFERGGELRHLCFGVIDRDDTEKDHPFYGAALNKFSNCMDTTCYQERKTRMNLLYALLSDEYLQFIAKNFQREVDDRLSAAYDSQSLIDLFCRISEAVGEPLMETLNLRLKQRFLLAPLVTVFVQGMTNDLLYCLASRDSETSKQIFQLLMDSMSLDEEM